jgi:hypothetical protein
VAQSLGEGLVHVEAVDDYQDDDRRRPAPRPAAARAPALPRLRRLKLDGRTVNPCDSHRLRRRLRPAGSLRARRAS